MKKELNNNRNVLISVIMSVYNENISFVTKAVESILAQTLSDFEFIIVIDNPNNNEIIEYLQDCQKIDRRLKLIINEENIGLAKSLNKGIDIAKGKYIARMDADDIAKPQRLEKQLEYIENKKCDMVCCLADKIDENDNVWGTIEPFPLSDNYIPDILTVQNIIIHPTVIMKNKSIKEINCYRPFSSCQDYDLWLRMITKGYKIGVLNEKLLCFRRHPNSITSSKHYMQYLNEKYIRILYKERIKNGYDTFSEENLLNFIKKNGANIEKKVKSENYRYLMYREGLKFLSTNKRIKGIIMIIGSLKAKNVRESVKTSIKARKIKKKYNKIEFEERKRYL